MSFVSLELGQLILFSSTLVQTTGSGVAPSRFCTIVWLMGLVVGSPIAESQPTPVGIVAVPSFPGQWKDSSCRCHAADPNPAAPKNTDFIWNKLVSVVVVDSEIC